MEPYKVKKIIQQAKLDEVSKIVIIESGKEKTISMSSVNYNTIEIKGNIVILRDGSEKPILLSCKKISSIKCP